MNSPLPRRAAIYARVSSQRQQKQATIQSQVTQLRYRAEQDRHQLLDEHILLDDGYSGSFLDRPALDRLRDLAKDRTIDLVYIHSPDRLARRYVHQVLLMEELERFGCKIVFLEHTPSKDPNSLLLTQIQGAIAEYERAQIAERARRGKLHHSRQGAIVAWRAAYGYSYIRYEGERGCWEVNEDEAPAVRELFGWVSNEAISLRQATKRLNASPWKPRGGGPWTTSTVQKMLTNEAYCGRTYYNRRRAIESDQTDLGFKTHKTMSEWRPREEWIAIPVPVIIDRDTFNRVQQQLIKNKAFSRRNLQRKDEYLLRSLLSCGVCGLSLIARSAGRYAYYVCRGNSPLSAGRVERCPAPHVYAPDLDITVWHAIESLLRSPDLMTNAWQHQQKQGAIMAPDVIEAELQRLHGQTLDAQRQIRRLVDGYQKGALRPEELSERRAHVEEKIAHWTEHQRRLESERPKWKEWKTVSENLSRFCEYVAAALPKLNFEERQKLLRKTVDRIVITAGQVTIKLAIPLSTNFDLTPLRPEGVESKAPGDRGRPAQAVKPAPPAPQVSLRPEPLAPERYKVVFTASRELRDKLDRLQALMHEDLAAVIEAAVTEKIERLEARRYAETKTPRKNLQNTDTSPRSRYIPAAVRRAVRTRDGDQCRFVDKNGRRCKERRGLEFHHHDPFGRGGDHDPAKISLMCRAHNAYLAEREYGKEVMDSSGGETAVSRSLRPCT